MTQLIIPSLGEVSSSGSYITADDMRTATLAEFCIGLDLTTDEADDTILTQTIARQSDRIDKATNDHFLPRTSLSLTLRGNDSSRLDLPKRCTSVSSVVVVNYVGATTTQDTDVYRLHSSLDADGADVVAPGAVDYIDIVPTKFITGASWASGTWPNEPNAVVVTGTFGWTVTPADIKRAVALLVYREFKPQADILSFATQVSDAGATYQLATGPTGIPYVDATITAFSYGSLSSPQVLIG